MYIGQEKHIAQKKANRVTNFSNPDDNYNPDLA